MCCAPVFRPSVFLPYPFVCLICSAGGPTYNIIAAARFGFRGRIWSSVASCVSVCLTIAAAAAVMCVSPVHPPRRPFRMFW